VSFCDVAVCWYKDRISLIQNDLSEKLLCKISDVTRFSFAQGGVAIFESSNQTTFTVVDLVNLKSFVITDASYLKQSEIKKRLILKPCGLSLPDDDLSKICGPDFVFQRDKTFEEFRRKQVALMTPDAQFKINETISRLEQENKAVVEQTGLE